MLVKTQHKTSSGHTTDPGAVRSRTITNAHLDEFSGGSGVTSYQYRQWKNQVEVSQLNQLTGTELALVIYTQVKGEAKRSLEALELDDLKSPGALGTIWSLLDAAHAKMAHERADGAYDKWENAHQRHGQSMGEWITHLR